MVVPSAPRRERGNYYWHSDKSYHDVPSLMTMLHGVEIPSRGGETQFANTALAYAALDEATRAAADRLTRGAQLGTESYPIPQPTRDRGTKARTAAGRSSGRAHAVRIPIRARRHSISATTARTCSDGRRTRGARCCGGWRRSRHGRRSCIRTAGGPGDLVLWDNRCTLHRALPHTRTWTRSGACAAPDRGEGHGSVLNHAYRHPR